MSSRKLLVHDFVKRYFARWGKPPSLREIAAATGIARTHAHRLIHELAAEKMLTITAGKTRGIRLPDRRGEMSEADALVHLSQMGWTIGDGDKIINPRGLGGAFPVLDHPGGTDSRLSGTPVLDHPGHPGAGKRTGTRGKIDESEVQKRA